MRLKVNNKFVINGRVLLCLGVPKGLYPTIRVATGHLPLPTPVASAAEDSKCNICRALMPEASWPQVAAAKQDPENQMLETLFVVHAQVPFVKNPISVVIRNN